LRRSVFALGIFSLSLGIVGIFIPLLPTAPFVILTAWCFVRSSEKAHNWLYRQPFLSKALRDWDRSGSIATKSKILAITMISFSMVFVWFAVALPAVKVTLMSILILVSLFIITRPKP